MQLSENRGIRGRFSGTAEQRLGESGYAAYLQDTGTRATFSENFSSIRSAVSSPLDDNNNKKMKQTCLPVRILKPLPGFQKITWTSLFLFFAKPNDVRDVVCEHFA